MGYMAINGQKVSSIQVDTSSGTYSERMEDIHFEIVRILYHQEIDVHFLGRHCRLAHCDKAYVIVDSENTWLNSLLMQKICYKIYNQWIKKDDSFVALLELVVVDSLDRTGKCSKYSCLIGITSPISIEWPMWQWDPTSFYSTASTLISDQSGIVCVSFSSVLAPENKCFEINNNFCFQVPYQIISMEASLGDYKCLVVDNQGWLFVVTSNLTSCHLILANEYVVIGSTQTVYTVTKHHNQNKIFNSIKKLNNGHGLLVKYGVLLCNIEDLPDSNCSGVMFIGNSSLLDFVKVQQNVDNLIGVNDLDFGNDGDHHHHHHYHHQPWPEAPTTAPPIEPLIDGQSATVSNDNFAALVADSQNATVINDCYPSDENSVNSAEPNNNSIESYNSNIVLNCYQTPLVYYDTAWCYDPQFLLYNCYFNGYWHSIEQTTTTTTTGPNTFLYLLHTLPYEPLCK